MEAFFGIGGAILGFALAWGLFRNQSRNRANDRVGDAAAREQYQHPNSYDPEKYRTQLGPKR
jgi:hypothetical protein